MGLLIYVLLVITTLIIGFISAMLGIGGGILLVPTLLFLGFDARQAVGISISAVMFTGISSFIEYFRQRRVDWKLGLLLESVTVPGAILGAYTTTLISTVFLEILFALLLLINSVIVLKANSSCEIEINSDAGQHITAGHHRFFYVRRTLINSDDKNVEYIVNLALVLPASFLAGFAAGFFGISGGVLKVPVLIAGGLPVNLATGTSSLMVTITAFAAFLTHASLGHVNYVYLVFIAPSLVIGAQMGARFSHRVSATNLRYFIAGLYILLAGLLVLRYFA
ncbi:sulfite exporter TauE/SafE family protein [Candidatus Borrarchaeum sp.]|uniref:sulfite exporter TauE/SafE family protein n=1 Tax=Candidatus Borrarchaeum sp. TaxID=2846742 RepID=UPI002579952E|nr:sulfite exporter TauE/SafE family protein [Candidatus Borrarchaeum sp.]